jgi:hypothetical protein
MSGSSTGPKRPKPKWIDQTTFHTGYQTIPKNGPIVGTETKDKALETNQPKPVRTIVSVFRKDITERDKRSSKGNNQQRTAIIRRQQPSRDSNFQRTTMLIHEDMPSCSTMSKHQSRCG